MSTDFLLRLTNIPDRKNYDIGELGPTALAARNLYTGKVNSAVVSRMLEHPRFSTLTIMIAQYFDDTLAAGVAVQNQIFASMGELLLGAGQRDAAQAVVLSKTPPHQVDLSKIQNIFMAMLKEIKKDMASELVEKQAAAKDIVAQMMADLTKGGDRPLTEITPEQMTDAILHTVDTSVFDPERGTKFLTCAVWWIRKFMQEAASIVLTNDEVSLDESENFSFPQTYGKSPEQIILQTEIYAELHDSLRQITARERTYLLYRYGFTDEDEHPIPDTAALFHLTEKRAQKTERAALDDLWHRLFR